ncbi:hypothetical protein ACJRO7_000289 [Eucalyptus globulus]|uniref:Dihydrodipicolinate reductase C-terminal domain-containing protein n=1 Tax=Eucalyptus globulus TaxID=34317 RepID=A0ABD3LWW4_EUCGL
MSALPAPRAHLQARALKKLDIPIMLLKVLNTIFGLVPAIGCLLWLHVNSCLGKMGKAVIKAADYAGLDLIPMSFGCAEEAGKTVEVFFCEYPNMIAVNYTVPDAVNSNAELYCNVGVPFVVAFLAAMEIMAEQFSGAFYGYFLKSHQSSKLDTSGTAKAVISCFKKLGVSFDMDQIQMICDPKQQMEMVGVPEEYLSGHAFHLYHLSFPDETVPFEFQHNVCGRSIYAEGTVGAVLFLVKKIQQKADQHIHNMIDVLREVSMR